jgi:hypothetical protein
VLAALTRKWPTIGDIAVTPTCTRTRCTIHIISTLKYKTRQYITHSTAHAPIPPHINISMSSWGHFPLNNKYRGLEFCVVLGYFVQLNVITVS